MTPTGYSENLTILQKGLELLPDKPEETFESTLQALWLTAAGEPASVVVALQRQLPELSPTQRDHLAELIAARLGGTPLAHLTERQHFMDLEFVVGPDALIPRRETELLAEAAEVALQDSPPSEPRRAVDIGTGCGNLAIALSLRCPDTRFVAIDISADAIGIARRNAAHHGLANRLEFLVGDLFAPIDRRENQAAFNLIVCNPPYISSGRVPQMAAEISDHEPAAAFDGGFGGLSVVRRLIAEAPKFLIPGGLLVFEIGAGQGEALAARARANSEFDEVKTISNSDGVIRVIAARRRTD